MAWIIQTYTSLVTRLVNTPGWNAGARTIASVSTDGGFTFFVGQATGIVCGFNTNDTTTHYQEIQHGFFIEPSRFKIIENGVTKSTWFSYSSGHAFKISRELGVVEYYCNDILIYTSLQTSIGEVFLDCSLYSYLDTIYDVFIFEGGRVHINGEISSLTALASDSLQSYIFGEVYPLDAEAVVLDINTVNVELTPFIAKAARDVLNYVDVSVSPLTAVSEEVLSLVPEYNSINANLRALQTYGLQYDPDPAFIDVELSSLIAFCTDIDGQLLFGQFSPLFVNVYLTTFVYLIAEWPSLDSACTFIVGPTETSYHEISWRSVHHQRHVTEYHSPFVYETHTDLWSSEGQVLHNVHYTSYESVSTLGAFALHTVFYQSTTEASLVSSSYKIHETFYQSVEELAISINQQLHTVFYQSVTEADVSLSDYQIHEIFYQSVTEADVSLSDYQIHEIFYQSSSGSLAVQTQSVSYSSSTTVSTIVDTKIHTVSWESVPNIWNSQEVTWKSITADYQSHKTSWSLQPTNYKEHSTRYGSINTTPTTMSGLVYVRV